jgi:hypothetical protein
VGSSLPKVSQNVGGQDWVLLHENSLEHLLLLVQQQLIEMVQ